jgi:hypothetical protein
MHERPFAEAKKSTAMFKPGDHVFIDGSQEEGTVKEVHPHEIVVRVVVPGGHETRKYALEALRLDATLSEDSKFVDH